MDQIKAHDYPEIYQDLEINLAKLGCIMLDTEPLPDFEIDEQHLYYANDKEKFWINGKVGGGTPHVTLLYGLLPGVKKWHVDSVLEDWWRTSVEIESVGFFESPYPDEQCYCIIAHIKKIEDDQPGLIEANQRLTLLPHMQTFAGYKSHLTLAYIKKDEAVRDEVIESLSNQLIGATIPTKEINYGNEIR